MRFLFSALVASLTALASLSGAQAQSWPDRPVRMVLPGPPGGGPDRVTRMLADHLSKMWGQPVIVDNKPGASSRVGAEIVANASPDGYTLLSTFGTHTMVKALFPDTKYDPLGSFTAVVPFVRAEVLFVVNADSPYKSLRQLVDAHKASGQPIPYGHFGQGSGFHLFGLMLGRNADVPVLPVPYKGEALQLNDLLGKQLQTSFNSVGTAVGHIRAGKVRALALVAPTRSTVLPDVPTFGELGFPGMDNGGWFGLLAPAKTDKRIVDKINADVSKVLALPAVAQALREQGLQPIPTTPETFQAQMNAEVPRWRALVQEFNVKAE